MCAKVGPTRHEAPPAAGKLITDAGAARRWGVVGLRLISLAALGLSLLLPTRVAQAQFDQTHHIPPFFARTNVGEHYIVVSTLEVSPFSVTVTDGAGNPVTTILGVSRTTPQTFNLPGTGYAQTGVLDTTELNLVSTQGLILTGPLPFSANIRHKQVDQGLSLTSKGSFGLGTDFRSGHLITSTNQISVKAHFLSVMAIEPGTTVTFSGIDPSLTFFGTVSNPFSTVVNLNAGESYVIAYLLNDPASNTANDPNLVNGIHVTATKPIAFDSGSWLAGNQGAGRDIGVDQIVPIDRIGAAGTPTAFVVVKGSATTNAAALERPGVVAAFNNTQIRVSGVLLTTINAGQHFFIPASEYSAAGNMFIETSQPAFIYQSTSANNLDGNGMSFIPPLRCNGTTDVVIGDPFLVGGSATAIIVARTGASVAVDGVLLAGSGDPVPGTVDWVTYAYSVPAGATAVDVSSTNVVNVSLVTKAGNRGSAGFFSGFADSPSVEVTGGTDLCVTSPITLTASGAGFASFQWYKDGVVIPGATAATYTTSLPGAYSVAGTLINDQNDPVCNGGTSAKSPPVTLSDAECQCGNGLIGATEQCDDSNTTPGDGCSATCMIETGYGCVGEPSVCTPICGDTLVVGNEVCDDGNTVNCDGCRGDCSAIEGTCGDGALDLLCEVCDDSNTVNCDGCRGDCSAVEGTCGDGALDLLCEVCDDNNNIDCDGCRGNCSAVETGCGDGFICAPETCEDGNTSNNDSCLNTCTAAVCGDGFICSDVATCTSGGGGVEACDDGGIVIGDGCDNICSVETGYSCAGQPSVCTVPNPVLEQLIPGTWPEIMDRFGRYIAFVSTENLNNDSRQSASNADGSEEVFLLNRSAKAKNGPGVCLGGPNGGLPCNHRRDCPGFPPIKRNYCARFTQLTDTTVAGTAFEYVRGGRHARVVFSDLTGGPSQLTLWTRRTFEKVSPAAAVVSHGQANAPSAHTTGRYVPVESTADLTGGNPDGNSEIFLYDAVRDAWTQVTDTLAPVQNHRPKITGIKRIVFDSNGDLDNIALSTLSNPDGNREIFRAYIGTRRQRIRQLTSTVGADLQNECAARRGSIVFFSSTGNFDNDPASSATNADANIELFRWRRRRGGQITQLTVSTAGENLNADCLPGGRWVVFETTADLDNQGAANRRVYVLNANSGYRAAASPSLTGNSQRPRISGRYVIFESTSDLTGLNPSGVSVIYLYDRKRDQQVAAAGP